MKLSKGVSEHDPAAEALFYHAFPRFRRGVDAQRDQMSKGVEVLESIFTLGLLLTPELLEIPPNPDSDSPEPPRTQITQRRACFTHMERSAFLRSTTHRSTFGRFAIGLRSDEARALGLLPTFYYYRAGRVNGQAAPVSLLDSGLSEQILYRLAEIRRLLIAVARIEARGMPHRTAMKNEHYLKMHGLWIDDEREVAKRIDSLPAVDAERMCEFLATERVLAWNLAEWMEIVLSVFQTADSHSGSDHLAYYAQREWRLVQIYVEGLLCIPLNRKQLANDDMISGELKEFAQHARSVLAGIQRARDPAYFDECSLLIGRNDRPFRDFIVDVVGPRQYQDEIAEVLRRARLLRQFRRVQGGEDILFTRADL